MCACLCVGLGESLLRQREQNLKSPWGQEPDRWEELGKKNRALGMREGSSWEPTESGDGEAAQETAGRDSWALYSLILSEI